MSASPDFVSERLDSEKTEQAEVHVVAITTPERSSSGSNDTITVMYEDKSSSWTSTESIETARNDLWQPTLNGGPDYNDGHAWRQAPKKWTSKLRKTLSGRIEDPTLPPIDGGRRAWLFMFGAFIIEGFMWGVPMTFGVFKVYYQNNLPFKGSKNLAIIGTLCTGISYLGTPLITPFTIKYPQYQQHMIWAGWMLCICALVGSSFATQVWHLIVTQGLLYGIGFLFIYYPLISMLNEWFVEKRGLAYGIMFSAGGFFGLGLPFLTEMLLDHYGYAITLRTFAIALFIIVGPTIPLMRGRITGIQSETLPFNFNLSILRRGSFIAISLSNLLQGTVFFLPSIFISSYASKINLTSSQGTLVLSVLYLTQILSQIAIGYISDRTTHHIPMTLSALLSSITVLLAWGFSKNFSSLLTFSLMYGLFAGGYGVLYCRFVTELTGDRAAGLWLYGIFDFQRGLGNVVGGLISGHLTRRGVDWEGYGVGKFRDLVLFVGGCLLLSSFGGLGWFCRSAKPESCGQESGLKSSGSVASSDVVRTSETSEVSERRIVGQKI